MNPQGPPSNFLCEHERALHCSFNSYLKAFTVAAFGLPGYFIHRCFMSVSIEGVGKEGDRYLCPIPIPSLVSLLLLDSKANDFVSSCWLAKSVYEM